MSVVCQGLCGSLSASQHVLFAKHFSVSSFTDRPWRQHTRSVSRKITAIEENKRYVIFCRQVLNSIRSNFRRNIKCGVCAINDSVNRSRQQAWFPQVRFVPNQYLDIGCLRLSRITSQMPKTFFRSFITKAKKAEQEKKSPLARIQLVKRPAAFLERFGKSSAKEGQSPALSAILEEAETKKERDLVSKAFVDGFSKGSDREGARRKNEITMEQIWRIFRFIAYGGIAILILSNLGIIQYVSSSNMSEVAPEEVSVTFNDVKGVEEAKAEVMEIVSFLKNPEKYCKLGARLPKGILLVGPPGCGKTLLARAIAGEAGVSFFHACGSQFDELFVGTGAKKLRELFSAAKEKSPCVVFIDEIDSVGQKRSSSILHPYANQTINQLLAEMDGFEKNDYVFVLGATNRADVLDKALLRPGRFDMEVHVSPPDFEGRKEIFELYLSKIVKGPDVDIDALAARTTGFTGADIENMVNQAALHAAAKDALHVDMASMDFARDKVIMGPEKKRRIPDEDANRKTAFHEAGHALVSYYTLNSSPLHKVTIIPRGASLGHTAYLPKESEQYGLSKAQILAKIDVAMGGRAAEELIFGDSSVTTGVSNDLKTATQLATFMVKELGMSEKVGLRTFEEKEGLLAGTDAGQSVMDNIDAEISRLLNESYERARSILKSHSAEHKRIAEALLKYETLSADDLKKVIDGQPLDKRKG